VSFPRPALTVDVVALAGDPPSRVLLIRRANAPFAGAWALPGGFVDESERCADAAARELSEETGLTARELSLLGVYDTAGRDPRGWTVSVVYRMSAGEGAPEPRGGDDAAEARWHPLAELPPLSFDHAQVIADAIR
jgi:8-oxo-dGTP diphosphatase